MIADEIRINHLGGFKPETIEAEAVCQACEGGGWQGYAMTGGYGLDFRPCPACGNPQGHPKP